MYHRLMNDRQHEASLTVGQFGRLCQLSRKALRLYDERGLLPPARIDPDSGYRYYRRDQVATARRIRLLRVVGSEDAREEVRAHLAELADSSRIDARAVAVVSDHPARAIAEESSGAALVILGFSPPEEGSVETFFEVMTRLTRGLDRALLVWSAGGVELES